MDAVVDLGQGALEVPTELEPVVFLVLETLKFLDEVELELRAEPRAKLEGDVPVCVGAATVTPCPRLKPNGTGGLDPLPRSRREAVQASLGFKGLEFETFKTRVVDLLPMVVLVVFLMAWDGVGKKPIPSIREAYK
jgi:hypothetical protein